MNPTFTAQLRADLDGFKLHLDFVLERCPFTVVWGKSGSGKTSLLRILAGLEQRAEGRLSFGDELWQDERRFVPAYKRPVGYVFQSQGLLPHLNVLENLKFAQKRSSAPVSIEDVAKQFGIQSLLQKSVHQLSGGETQRVSLARTILTNPSIILMDEPIASVDAKGRSEIIGEIRKIASLDVPIIYVTHSMEELLLLANRVLILAKGKVGFYGDLLGSLSCLDESSSDEEVLFSILEMEAGGFDQQYFLQSVHREGDELFFNRSQPLERGALVRLLVNGKDVLLFKNPPVETSALNVLAGKILKVQEYGEGQIQVILKTSSGVLRAKTTKKSYDHLQLCTGDRVWAVTKAVSILV